MKRRFQRLLSILAAVTFVLTTFSVPVLATETRVDGRLNGNELFDEWSKTAREAEAQRLLADTEKTLDQQGSFEAAVRRMREIESAHAGGYLEREEISTGLNMGDSEPAGTPEEAWEKFVQNKMRTSGLDEKAIQEEYELRIFTDEAFAGEERFAIYSSDNVVSDGWQEDSNNPGKWWYLENGAKVKGWKTIGEYKYFFNRTTYYMHHGWLTEGRSKYFMGRQGLPETGRMYTDGWMNDGEGGGTAAAPLWYYFNTSTGKMLHGWLTYKGGKYYLGVPGDESSGLMYDKGWMEESGKWYYIGSDGIMKTGWLTLGSGTFYLGINGQMQTGWQTISGSQYYFNSDGQMQTGWQTIDQKTYYFRSGGTMVTGSYILDGTTYLFDSLGVCINQNPPSTMNNMTYNFTFYQESSNGKITSAIDDMVEYFYVMGYQSNRLISGVPAKTYARWPYDKITFIHGHGMPGHTQYVTKYEDDDDEKATESCNWLLSSMNWTYTGVQNRPVISSNERVISDYASNQLSNNLFTLFISCFSARNEHKDYAADNVTVTGTRTVDRNTIEATIDAGSKCAMGYYYSVRGGEYYAQELVYSLYLGLSIEEAIDRANIMYGITEAYIEEDDTHGELCYASPHDPRNQRVLGDTSTIVYERPLASSSQLFAASDKYHVTNIQSDKSETIGSKFRLTTKMSAHHNLISGPDADVSYNAVIKNGIEYYYDNAGRLTLVYTNQRKADNTGIQLSLPRLEEHAREFLSSNGIMMGKYNVSDVIQSVVGHQFIFEDDSKNLIYVSMYDNGTVSGANFYYGDVFDITVSETDQQYFAEKFQNETRNRVTSDVISHYSVSYQRNNGVLYAVYNITYRDANGLYYCEEMVFGK